MKYYSSVTIIIQQSTLTITLTANDLTQFHKTKHHI